MKNCKRFGAVLALVLIAFVFTGCVTTTDPKRPVYLIKLQKGDSLVEIARKYDTTWQDIVRLNGLTEGKTIPVGTVIRVVPGKAGIVPGATPAKVKLPPLAATKSNHNVYGNNYEYNEADEKDKKRGLLFGSVGKVSWPLEGSVSSGFGRRWGRKHQGLDIRAPRGTEIRAAAAGRVIFSGRQRGYGNTVIILHRGFKTLYAHCHSLLVEEGDYVDRGFVIATVGSTGRTTGPHLHFEIRVKDKPLNPISWLPAYPNT